jgi:hypothetical protein
LMPLEWPSRPWERIGTDLFEYQNKTYILVVDYYSRWIEARPLPNTQANGVIEVMCSIFATHGIPDIVVSDNGPQYASERFKNFAKSYGFTHTTSSPHYPCSNGEAERAVRTVKNILRKNQDPYLGLLSYRSAPLLNGLSPSQLLMGRRLRTTLPVLPEKITKVIQNQNLQDAREKEEEYRRNQAKNYDRRHRVARIPALDTGDTVWIRDQDREGTIIQRMAEPRSYLVKTNQGTTVRRNRGALIHTGGNQPVPQESPPNSSEAVTSPTKKGKPATPRPETARPSPKQGSGTLKTKSGRMVKPPSRLNL